MDDHGALSVSKRALRALVVQGIHYPYFHLAGPFQYLDSFGTDRVSFSVLVNSSATSCVIHTGSGASSSSYLSLAVRVDDPGRSAILSVLTLAPCLLPQVETVAFRLCRTMSRHRAQFNYLGAKFQNLFLV